MCGVGGGSRGGGKLCTTTLEMKALEMGYLDGLGGTTFLTTLTQLNSILFFYLPHNHNSGGDKWLGFYGQLGTGSHRHIKAHHHCS